MIYDRIFISIIIILRLLKFEPKINNKKDSNVFLFQNKAPYPETPSATATTPPLQLLTKNASSPPLSTFRKTKTHKCGTCGTKLIICVTI